MRFAGDTVARMLGKKLKAGPVDGLRAFLTLWREILTSTGFQAGCPVLAVSIEEAADDDRLAVLVVAAEVFTGWETQLAESLREHGVDPAEAEQLGTLVVAAAEGAVAMCRAQRSTQPLDRVSGSLESLLATAIDGSIR